MNLKTLSISLSAQLGISIVYDKFLLPYNEQIINIRMFVKKTNNEFERHLLLGLIMYPSKSIKRNFSIF